jgi:hypothetical protein
MITTFLKYKLNEAWQGDKSILSLLFSSFGNQFKPDYIENYINTLTVANDEMIVQQSVNNFKEYVKTDPKILNKQEVYNKIDNTPIVWRKNDALCYKLYQEVKMKHPCTSNPSCWCSTLSNGQSVIFLARDASHNSILHELSHAIEPVVKIDPKLLENFNFSYSKNQVDFLFKAITDFSLELRTDLTREKEYLSDPSEVWARLNNLKMFLYKKNFLRIPNADVDQSIITKIMTGEVYKSLDDKGKKEMSDSDFMQILVFLNVNKFPQVKQFVENSTKNQ